MRLFRISVLLYLSLSISVCSLYAQANATATSVRKNGLDLDLRSNGRAIADDVVTSGSSVLVDAITPIPGITLVPQIQFRGTNVQVNDPALDNIQDFPTITPPARPFFDFTQSETSIAAYGRNIVATYNTSANQPITQVGNTLVYAHRFLSGFSSSTDGGLSWKSGFMPPVLGSIFTFGDPSVGVDRNGVFYFAGLGANAVGRATIQVNRSTDGGLTWSDAVIVQQDDGGDKEWLAVGRDPTFAARDNVYVTWTSFQSTGAQLRFGRSTDGGLNWTTKTVYAPTSNPNPTFPQNSLQASNPYVDRITGTLYVPFVHYSNSDVDFIQLLISKDAGETFSFVNFNVPGTPGPTLLPIVQAGAFIDCGNSGGLRLSIYSGNNIGGRFGLPSYVQASRLITQPAFAARNGVLHLAWNNSTSTVFGDPNSRSNILYIRSDDDGATWTASIVANPFSFLDKHHVLPTLTIDNDPNDVHIGYYTQHNDGRIDVDMVNSHDRGNSFPLNRTVRLTSGSFALAPTNIPLSPPSGANYNTTNYDRTIRPCYCLGEYMSARSANGSVYVLWGDGRNTVTHPSNPRDPLSGQTHSQEDVFFQEVKAQ